MSVDFCDHFEPYNVCSTMTSTPVRTTTTQIPSAFGAARGASYSAPPPPLLLAPTSCSSSSTSCCSTSVPSAKLQLLDLSGHTAPLSAPFNAPPNRYPQSVKEQEPIEPHFDQAKETQTECYRDIEMESLKTRYVTNAFYRYVMYGLGYASWKPSAIVIRFNARKCPSDWNGMKPARFASRPFRTSMSG